jgi:hypothetical protein
VEDNPSGGLLRSQTERPSDPVALSLDKCSEDSQAGIRASIAASFHSIVHNSQKVEMTPCPISGMKFGRLPYIAFVLSEVQRTDSRYHGIALL